MLFWRARAIDSNKTLWDSVRGGGAKLNTSVIRSELKGEKESRGKEEGEQEVVGVWCKVLSCIGKMTLAKPKGAAALATTVSTPAYF